VRWASLETLCNVVIGVMVARSIDVYDG
jgi:hypothetical protein